MRKTNSEALSWFLFECVKLTVWFLYSNIETNKQYTIQQMDLVHETLNAFERDFVNKLDTLGNDLKDQINVEGAFVRA